MKSWITFLQQLPPGNFFKVDRTPQTLNISVRENAPMRVYFAILRKWPKLAKKTRLCDSGKFLDRHEKMSKTFSFLESVILNILTSCSSLFPKRIFRHHDWANDKRFSYFKPNQQSRFYTRSLYPEPAVFMFSRINEKLVFWAHRIFKQTTSIVLF